MDGVSKKVNSFFAAQFSYYLLIWMIHSRFNNNNRVKNLIKDVFDRYTVLKPLGIKKYWKRMGQSLFIIKTYKHLQLKCLKYKMTCLLRLCLIYCCLEREIIITLGKLRQLSFTFYMNSISW